MFLLALAPFVVFGTWVAAFAYAGHAPEDVMALVRRVYRFVFAGVLGAELQMPSFSFDLAAIPEALITLVVAAADVGISPEDLLIAGKALTALNFALSLLKPLIAALGVVLAAGESAASTNMPFSIIAGAETYDEVKMAVATAMKSTGDTFVGDKNGAKIVPLHPS